MCSITTPVVNGKIFEIAAEGRLHVDVDMPICFTRVDDKKKNRQKQTVEFIITGDEENCFLQACHADTILVEY